MEGDKYYSPTTLQRGVNGVSWTWGRHDGNNVFLMGQMCSTWRKCQWWGFGLRLSTKLLGSIKYYVLCEFVNESIADEDRLDKPVQVAWTNWIKFA